MIHIQRNWLLDGRPVLTAWLTCDLCGRRLDQPAIVRARRLVEDVAVLRNAAQISGRWCLRTVWRPGDDRPVVGDVCGCCRGPALALRKH